MDRVLGWAVRVVPCAFACVLFAAEARAQERAGCSSDADCDTDFRCLKEESATDCAVPRSGSDGDPKDAPSPCESTTMIGEVGECVPRPITCEEDRDCPDGLTCRKSREESCTAPTPGGDPEPECTVEEDSEGRCSFSLIECSSDAQCEAGWACTETEGAQTCTSEPTPACNGDCPPQEPKMTCTRNEQRVCLPKRVECVNGACPSGLRCVELSEDVQDDAPPAWQGAAKLCLPEGIALVIEGRVEAGGTSAHESATRAQNDAPSDEKTASRGEANPAPSSAPSSSNDCAVSAVSASAGGLAWLGLFGIACCLWIARKRA